MSNEQILKKAIEKAVGNGWEKGKFYLTGWEWYGMDWHDNDIIFSHSFAKAFWGTHLVCGDCGREFDPEEQLCKGFCEMSFDYPNPTISWMYHLHQMAVQSDRMKYLGQFV